MKNSGTATVASLVKENKNLKYQLELAVGMMRSYKEMHAEVLAAKEDSMTDEEKVVALVKVSKNYPNSINLEDVVELAANGTPAEIDYFYNSVMAQLPENCGK